MVTNNEQEDKLLQKIKELVEAEGTDKTSIHVFNKEEVGILLEYVNFMRGVRSFRAIGEFAVRVIVIAGAISAAYLSWKAGFFDGN